MLTDDELKTVWDMVSAALKGQTVPETLEWEINPVPEKDAVEVIITLNNDAKMQSGLHIDGYALRSDPEKVESFVRHYMDRMVVAAAIHEARSAPIGVTTSGKLVYGAGTTTPKRRVRK